MSPRWTRAGMVIALIVFLAPAALSQARPLTIGVGSAEAGWPARIQLGALLDDPGLREALHSALPLRFHLRVELWRKGIFDRLVVWEEISVAILQDPLGGGYSVETGNSLVQVGSITQAQTTLNRFLSPDLKPRQGGRHYYLATLVVETLSLSDLDELRRWLRGEVAPAIEGRGTATRAVERGLRRVVTRVIGLPSRRYEATSGTFEAG